MSYNRLAYIGVDPGVNLTACAAVDTAGAPTYLCMHRKDTLSSDADFCRDLEVLLGQHSDAIEAAIERPEYRYGRGKGSPNDLIRLGCVAGAAARALGAWAIRVRFVTPTEWKGSVPKLPHHRRLMRDLGWAFKEAGGKDKYVVPMLTPAQSAALEIPSGPINPTDWNHALDAIALARWLWVQYADVRRNSP